MDKRIELHCHTSESKLDAVPSIKELIEYAYEIGLGGVAITDHGTIQAFEEAERIYKEMDQDDFKLIYGLEAYICEDEYGVVYHDKNLSLENEYVAIDIETTGFSPKNDRIVEIAAVKFDETGIKETFHVLINPEIIISDFISELIGITNESVQNAPLIKDVLPRLIEFCKNKVIVAHNASFDMEFLRETTKRMGMKWNPTVVDTYAIAVLLLRGCKRVTLESVANELDIELPEDVNCINTARAVIEIFMKLRLMLKERGIEKLSEIKDMAVGNADYVKKKLTSHATILVQNQIGMENLKKIVKESYDKFYGRIPIVPKSLISQYREGLLIGSGCEAGELFRALVKGDTDEAIERIQQFYDYFEIQPIANNYFMISSPRYDNVNTEDDLKELNRQIATLGKKQNKPVVASGDVHYIKKEDAYRREAFFKEKGFSDTSSLDSLYLRDAKDMLKEFEYLGADIAKEVVISNPQHLSDLIEVVNV